MGEPSDPGDLLDWPSVTGCCLVLQLLVWTLLLACDEWLRAGRTRGAPGCGKDPAGVCRTEAQGQPHFALSNIARAEARVPAATAGVPPERPRVG